MHLLTGLILICTTCAETPLDMVKVERKQKFVYCLIFHLFFAPPSQTNKRVQYYITFLLIVKKTLLNECVCVCVCLCVCRRDISMFSYLHLFDLHTDKSVSFALDLSNLDGHM